MRVRIVVPVLNNLLLTVQTLASLGQDHEVVVVDTGSTDRTPGALASFPHVRYVLGPPAPVYGAAVNFGASLPGDYDVLIISNNDTVWTPGSLRILAEAARPPHEVALPFSPRDVEESGLQLPKLKRPQNVAEALDNVEKVARWWSETSGRFRGYRPITHPYIPQGGYALAITRRLWEELKGFDERYRVFAEDYDLLARARERTKIVQCREAFVDHLEHQTVAWMGIERDVQMIRSRFLLDNLQHGIKEFVSVIIPVYNRVDSLCEALRSVTWQTMPHWRAYVIDDGSEEWDRVQSMMRREFGHLPGRIAAIHLPENRGPGHARNFGMRISTGKYVAFLDSDDIWYRDHLEKHFEAHEANLDLLMSYSKTDFAWRWYEDGRYRYRPDRHPESQLQDMRFSPDRLERECFIKTSAVVVSRTVFEKGAMFTEDPDHRSPHGAVEDWDFFRRVASMGRVLYVDRVTARTHWSKNALEEGHHSARLIPWADYTTIPDHWVVKPVKEAPPGRLGIVVPTRERPRELERLLSVIPETYSVVVVSDGEASRYPYEATEKRPHCALVEMAKRSGPSAARNRGAFVLKTEYVMFVDDDDLILSDALPVLEGHLGEADVIVPRILTASGSEITPVEGVLTTGLTVRLEAFERAGGFDEAISYAEERDLLRRLEAMGASIRHVEVAVAIRVSATYVDQYWDMQALRQTARARRVR